MTRTTPAPRAVCRHYLPGIGRECELTDRRAGPHAGGCLDCECYRDGSDYLGVNLYDMRRVADWGRMHDPIERVPRASFRGRLLWR